MKRILFQCHNCGGALEEIHGFKDLPRVTSDARPWASGGKMAVCWDCGLAQTAINACWAEDCKKIYKQYNIYKQAGGEEQPVMIKNVFQPRSRRLIKWLEQNISIKKSGRILDFGCGNGAFLKEFAFKYPHWELYGTEKNKKNIINLKKLKNFKKLFLDKEPLPKNYFDLISMIHVLEHVPKPSQKLKSLQKSAKKQSLFLVQVPDADKNPLSILIVDHSSHFTKQTIKHVLSQGGLKPIAKYSKHPISRELTFLCKKNKIKKKYKLKIHKKNWNKVVLNLLNFSAKARAASAKKNLIVFGSSIGATWLFAVCKGRIRQFLDEDKAKVNRKHLGIRIIGWSKKLRKKSTEIWLPSSDKKILQKLEQPKLKIQSLLTK